MRRKGRAGLAGREPQVAPAGPTPDHDGRQEPSCTGLRSRPEQGRFRLISRPGAIGVEMLCKEPVEQMGNILDGLGHHMHHACFPLEPPRHPQKPPGDHGAAELLVDLGPDHDIDHAGLVLEREEDHALGRAGPLAHQHEARHRHPCPRGRLVQPSGGNGLGRTGPAARFRGHGEPVGGEIR